MEQICPKDKCTGCSACMNACNAGAITMVADECGYVYPEIDGSLCVDCSLCAKVCPANVPPRQVYPLECHAVAVSDPAGLLSCASGGVATELSRYVVDAGGVVYGCSGADMRDVHHERVDTAEGLEPLKGSKYVQSRIGMVYRSVRQDLQAGRQVLFIGTPCQVAGLYGFLRHKDYPNLLTADLVCHGVPSQKMLSDNISYYCSKPGEEVAVQFRRKEKASPKCDAPWRIAFGWFYKTIHMRAMRRVAYHKDPYMYGFLRALTFRRSCYGCRYACIARCADFTLGDFWGLGRNAGFNRGKGVSAVLVNTERAKDVWRSASAGCDSVGRDVVEALKGNGQLQRPSRMHRNYAEFVALYPKRGLKYAVGRCLRLDFAMIALEEAKSKVAACLRRRQG